MNLSRRLFVKRCAAACGLAVLGESAFDDFVAGDAARAKCMGFRGDAAGALDAVAREAAFARVEGRSVRCELCPHGCVLAEGDRGFCRTRVVKDGRLYTVAYGNLGAAAVDPIEKKPLYHFLPGTPVVSVAMGGCNLRCLNCQNWDLSQARPHEAAQLDLMPAALVDLTERRRAPSVAFTYSEPLVAWEYVRDASALARERGLRTVLVTAGYVNAAPLRELCRTIDAVTLDVKAFSEARFRDLSGGRLAPVLRALEIIREEGVWVEVSFLIVPGHSGDAEEVGAFARWVARAFGPGTPLHLLRFHPAHRLQHLPPTPVAAMEEARRRARDAGLAFAYLGNVPGHEAGNTSCPRCGRRLIERDGFELRDFAVENGRCPCGEPIPGVFA